MATTHEVPEQVGRLKTVGRFVTQRFVLGRPSEHGESVTVATAITQTSGASPESSIFIACGGTKVNVSANEAAAIALALLEHLAHRANLVHGEPVDTEPDADAASDALHMLTVQRKLPEDERA